MPSRRSHSSAKSTSMMPFFFTMPISRTSPIKAISVSSLPVTCRPSSAPRPADGMVERWSAAGSGSHRARPARCRRRRPPPGAAIRWLPDDWMNALASPAASTADRVGQVQFGDSPVDALGGLRQRRPGRQVVGDRDRRERPLVVDRERRQRLLAPSPPRAAGLACHWPRTRRAARCRRDRAAHFASTSSTTLYWLRWP